MLLDVFYKVAILTSGGFGGGALCLSCENIYRKFKRESSKDNFSEVFNYGFYIGLGISLMYVINGKPLLV